MVQRILLGTLSVACLGTTLSAQNVRMNLFTGYTYQDRFQTIGSVSGFNEGRIADGQHYGGSIEFDIRPNKAIELLYQQQKTEGYLRNSFVEAGPFDVTLHYIMLGGLGRLPFSDVVSGYGGINLGAGWSTGSTTATKFAWGGKLGLQLNISEMVGIKMGAQILSPVQSVGGGLFIGTGGASAGISTFSTVYQFAWTGGLCFTLPRRGGSTTPPPPPAPRR
jgi:hypothetical protein